jgi:hypothetical protein
MSKLLIKLFAPLVACAALLAFAPAPTAGAAVPATRAASFVGTYTFHATIGGVSAKQKIVLEANGDAVDPRGKIAHWASTGKNFTIDYSKGSDTEHWVGTQTKKGINTKKKPGTVTTSFGDGTWYAVKTS